MIVALPLAFARRLSSITVTNNVSSWVSIRRSDTQRVKLSVHWRLLDAPDVVAEALVLWDSAGTLGDGIQQAINVRASGVGTAAPRLAGGVGLTRELRHYFGRAAAFLPSDCVIPEVTLGWSHARDGRKRSMRLGSASVEHAQIAIHPALDHDQVPETVLEMVMYHELCHLLRPPLSVEEARRTRQHRVHHRSFRALERRYPHLAEAEQWIRDNLSSLLSY
ncbi:MAG: putative metal-dependent hydrolase [Bradymonadia bacterium]|jgi:predicted metal-dependent hydrolase